MRNPRPAIAAGLDICCVLVFVIIGRASHTKGEALAGIASTAWPFLAGLAIGWAVFYAIGSRRPGRPFPAGVVAWLGTVALGMALRVVSGQGTAVAFIIVALIFLGLFLLGWRMLWSLASLRARWHRSPFYRARINASASPGGDPRTPDARLRARWLLTCCRGGGQAEAASGGDQV
jgi:hypothetical protein